MDRQLAMKFLDLYLYDYLVKHNLVLTAEAFAAEDELTVMPVGIDLPEGFLYEWWSIFWDIYCGGNLPQNVNPLVPMPDLQQNVNPSILMPDENVLMRAEDPLADIPGPSNRPNPIGQSMMPPLDTGNEWQSITEMMSGVDFNPDMLAIAGLNMVSEPTALDGMIAAAMHTEEVLRSPTVNLNSEMQLGPNVLMMDPSGSTSYLPMDENNNWPLSTAMDGKVGPIWVAATSPELPPLPSQLVTNNDVGYSWMALTSVELPPLPALQPPPPPPPPPAPQPLPNNPNNPEPEENGSYTSSNSPRPSDANI